MLALAACQAFAQTVYLKCEWASDISQPASQTVKFMNGSTLLKTATVTKAAGWKASVDVSGTFTVEPVALDDCKATAQKKDYGCKAFNTLAINSDSVCDRDSESSSAEWKLWLGDLPGEAQILGWEGWMGVLTARNSNAVVLAMPASSACPVYIISNEKLPTISYTATGYDGYYDGLNHGISVSFSTSGATVEYSTTGTSGWTATNPLYKDVGEYTVYFRITKSGYVTVADSRRVRILDNKDISLESLGYTGLYDGAWHSITVRVKTPSSGATVQYSMDGKTGWTTTNPSFLTGTNTVYYKVTATGYNTREGSETVAIANRTMTCSATGWAGPYDGYAHSVYAYPSSAYPPTSYTVYYSLDGTSWRTGNYGFAQLGTYTVYCKIRATGYDESNVATARVTIWEAAMTDGTIPGIVTDEIEYTGKKPWPDNPGYYKFIWGDWELCKWRVGEWTIEIEGDGAYTGKVSKVITVRPKSAWIISGGAQKEYDGEPLEYDRVDWGGFVDGEGVESAHAFGSQTDVGYSPNYFTYTLKTGTDPANYYLNVTTNRLTVIGANPVPLKYPAKLDITGPDTVNASVSREFKAWATYSDGTSNLVDSVWTLFPGEPDARLSSYDGSRVTLTPLPAGAGDELVLGASWQKEVGYSSVADGLVAWYPVNSWSVQDYSVYNRTGVGTNLSLVADRTEGVDGAFRFYGKDTGSMIEVAGAPSPLDGVTNAFTLAAWICPQAGESDYPVVYRGDQLSLSVSSAGVWSFCGKTLATSKKVSAGEWHHVALVWDGRKATAYLDAVKAGETSFMENRAVSTEPLRFGRVGDKWYSGDLDDMRIYSRAISASEVVTIKNGRDVTATTAIIKVEAEKVVNVPDTTTIPIAVDTQNAEGRELFSPAFAFTTGSTGAGSTGWFGQYKTVYGIYDEMDYDAAQSGKIPHGGTSWMQTRVTGAGTFSFWWKTESEPTYDYMVFTDNGEELARISGTNGWKHVAVNLTNATHTLRWEYVKDSKTSLGQDAAWVDRIEWEKLAVPRRPTGLSLVNATDGTYDDSVYVTWDKPISDKPITAYKVYRDGKAISEDINALAFADMTALPGVEYTYEVRAQNAAGWGSCGSDKGYRSVILELSPETGHFSNKPDGESCRVDVISNAAWKAEAGASWIKVAQVDGAFIVTADETDMADFRTGTITVTCGLKSTGRPEKYAATRIFTVTQSPRVDIGFAIPHVYWSTELLATTNGTELVDAYAPVSVFRAADSMKISFGWQNNSDVEVSLPDVEYKVSSTTNVVMKWKDAGDGSEEGKVLGPGEKGVCGFWSGDHFKALPPGDYRLEATLDPSNQLDDPARANNTAFFRFAIKDDSLEIGKDAFGDGSWEDVVSDPGNDFAQPAHAASFHVEARDDFDVKYSFDATGVQFGPYVPMNGYNGDEVVIKKPVDIVLLVDFTGSMDQCIGNLINNIGVFIDRLLIGDPANGISPISDVRIKIAGFSDFASDCENKNWFVENAFTKDRALLKEQLEALRVQCYGGGGNGAESSYDAIYYLAKGWNTVWDSLAPAQPTEKTITASPFREDVGRAIVMFTDEPPHVPLMAPGCEGVGVNGVYDALEEAGINLIMIGDGFYYGDYASYSANIHYIDDLYSLGRDSGRVHYEITGGKRTIANFTKDTAKLQELATTVYLQVPEERIVKEPQFSATAHGEGTLRFFWCNDSTAGTNNTFTFYADGLTNLTLAADRKWHEETITFGEGTHPLRWTYGKIDYEGDVADCGRLTDVYWVPFATRLEVRPNPAEMDYLGTNLFQRVRNDAGEPVPVYGTTFDVKCNTVWRIVDCPDWVMPVQDHGDGNGNIYINVTTNMSYAQRVGEMTIRAGDYGLPTDDITNVTVRITQEPHPFVPAELPQVVSIDIKPRWPWSSKVDIDFAVIVPKLSATLTDQKVRVRFCGLNKEGGDLVDVYPTMALLKECWAKTGGEMGFSQTDQQSSMEQLKDAEGIYYMDCPTSGIYRFTWDMANDWKNLSDTTYGKLTRLTSNEKIWWQDTFHTPEFSVRIEATDSLGNVVCGEAEHSVRVDTRLSKLSTIPVDPRSLNIAAGGTILTGKEMIGHPWGLVDPAPYDTTDKSLFPSNGWNSMDFVENLPAVFTNRFDMACVVNNAYIEGGTITTDTVWRADKEHIVRDNIFVHPDATLTIETDAIVKFCDSARIFVREKEAEPERTPQRHNIIVKGAAFAHAYDYSYGDDTLHHNKEGKVSWQGNGSAVIYSQTQGTENRETEEVRYQSGKDHQAINKVVLKELYWDAVKKSMQEKDFQDRYYSYGQKWADLPRPNETNLVFYGWYDANPKNFLGNGISVDVYTNETSKGGIVHFIDMDTVQYEGSSRLRTIYALIDTNGWANAVGGSKFPAIDASGGKIVLKNPVEVYDAKPHWPEIEALYVFDKFVPASYYRIDYGDCPDGFVTAGVYKVSVRFDTKTYINPPTVDFIVAPHPVEGSRVDVSPASSLYRPNWDGGVARPSITVTMDDIGEKGAPGIVPEDDYTINWDDDGWPYPGRYTFELVFNSNYSGTIKGKFTIDKNPEYYFTSPRFSASSADDAIAKAKAGAASKRILYFCGRNADDLEAEFVKSLITDDIRFNEWVVENFICWSESEEDEGSSYEKYAKGLTSVAYPLICVLNPDHPDIPIVRLSGYVDKATLREFLEVSLEAYVAISAADVSFKSGKGELVYNGKIQYPQPEDLEIVYAGVPIDSANYELVPDDESINVGEYTLRARMRGPVDIGGFCVTGLTERVAYKIVPYAVDDAASAATMATLGVRLVPPTAVFNGEVQRPEVVSSVEYSRCDYGTDDWYNAGEHVLAVTFDGNYKGTISKTFTITPMDAASSAVVELDREEEEVREDKVSVDLRPTVMSVADSYGNIYTRGVDYTVDYGADSGYTTAGTNYVSIVFKGNYTGVAKVRFVIKGVSPVADDLPDLGTSATPAEVAAAIAAIEWADAMVGGCITNATEYASFKAWVDAVGLDEGKAAIHAYISYRLSEFLASTCNLESIDGLEIEVNGFTLAETGSGTEMSVVVSIKKDETPYEFSTKLENVRKAFAKAIRRSATLDGLDGSRVVADEVQAESVPGDGTKIKLKIAPPAGESGFLKMKLD